MSEELKRLSIDELKLRFDALSKRRGELQARKDRLEGRKEAAQKALQEVEKECRDKGIDPEKIDEVLLRLKEKYKKQLDEAEEAMDFVSSKIAEMEA